ncbi:MAG: glycosyltransferase family 39 protein, partial [Bacteroidales bacterium]|nr:glycosyltransferase family 39 protein [Bacteroidales bacterium]
MNTFVQAAEGNGKEKGSFKAISSDPLFIFLALVSVAYHLSSIFSLEYHRDELLYFALANHPAAGYNSVPPLIGWVAWLMQELFGQSLFAVRISPSMSSGVMVLLAASIAREMGGSRYASFLAAFGLMIATFFMRSFFLFMPVFLEIFIWTIIFYLIIRYLNTRNDRLLLWIGICAGLALLTKYLGALFIAAIVTSVTFSGHRYILRKRSLWGGALLALIVFLPNLLWQVFNGFPVFGHMDELYRTQLVHMDIPLFLSEQLMMPAVSSVFLAAGILFLLFSKKTAPYRLAGHAALLVIFSLMLLKGKSYYTLGVFPFIIASGALALSFILRKLWLKMAFPVLLFILLLPIIPMGIPVYDREGLVEYFNVLENKYGIDLGRRFEDGSIHSLPQDYADMLGWEEMTALAARAWELVEDKDAAFIFGENYGQAAAISVIGRK